MAGKKGPMAGKNISIIYNGKHRGQGDRRLALDGDDHFRIGGAKIMGTYLLNKI